MTDEVTSMTPERQRRGARSIRTFVYLAIEIFDDKLVKGIVEPDDFRSRLGENPSGTISKRIRRG